MEARKIKEPLVLNYSKAMQKLGLDEYLFKKLLRTSLTEKGLKEKDINIIMFHAKKICTIHYYGKGKNYFIYFNLNLINL